MAFKIVSEVPYHTTRIPFPNDFSNEFFLQCRPSLILVTLSPHLLWIGIASSTLDWNLQFHDPLQTPTIQCQLFEPKSNLCQHLSLKNISKS